MASPSNLPSAVRISQLFYDNWVYTEALEEELRNDIDRLAGHFHARGEFESVFIRLVPWGELAGPPNSGHAAVADFLVCRAARAALSANVDPMIEEWARERKVDLRGALTGQDAADFASTASPLVKFHGCLVLGRESTLWTRAQLADPVIHARLTSCSEWMNLNLPGKHLVVVGFWTDWDYLNAVLIDALTINNASSVTVIDPSSAADLEDKAPQLWDALNGLSCVFEHIQASGADALENLRTEYSKVWARKYRARGEALARSAGMPAAVTALFDGLTGDDLYDLRRDAEGVPYSRAATLKAPPSSAAQAAYVHTKLLAAGASLAGAWLEYNGQLIRVVNGAGRGVAAMKEEYKEPATVAQAEIVVCAGAIDLGVPAKLIASGSGASIIRPAPGGAAKWLTLEQANVELGL